MADVQLVIDIAQKLTGQETTAELDKLTATLRGAGRDAEIFERAQLQAQAALDASSSEVSRLSGALGSARAEHRRVAAAEGEASDAARGYMRQIKALEGELDDAAKAQRGFAKQMRNVEKVTGRAKDALGDQASRISQVKGALGDLGGPFGRLGESILRPVQGFVEIGEVMGTSSAAALTAAAAFAAVAAAIVAVTAVAAALTAVMTTVAVTLANTRRNADLAAEAFDALNPSIAAVRGEFSGITRDTGVSAGRLQELAASLDDAGVSADNLPGALKAAALAEAALGQGGANDFIAQIKGGELAVDEFTANAQRDLGGIVQHQMLGLGSQAETLKRNLSGLFGGLEIEGALGGVAKLVGLFDETTSAGKAIKFLFEEFFQPLVDSVDEAATAVEAFVLGVLIGLVSLYIRMKPVIKAVAEFFGFDDPTTEETFKKITAAGEVVAYIFAGIGAAFLAAAAILASAVALMAAPFVATAAIVTGAVYAIVAVLTTLGEAFTSAYEWIAGIKWGELGMAMMQGLADGISSAATAVVKSITGAVTGAIKSAKELLGIASPSKVFMSIGGDTGEGFTRGIEAEADRAQGALAELTSPPAMEETPLSNMGRSSAAEPSGSRAENKQPSGASLNLAGAQFIFNGVENAEQAEERFSEALTRLLEGDAAMLGAA